MGTIDSTVAVTVSPYKKRIVEWISTKWLAAISKRGVMFGTEVITFDVDAEKVYCTEGEVTTTIAVLHPESGSGKSVHYYHGKIVGKDFDIALNPGGIFRLPVLEVKWTGDDKEGTASEMMMREKLWMMTADSNFLGLVRCHYNGKFVWTLDTTYRTGCEDLARVLSAIMLLYWQASSAETS